MQNPYDRSQDDLVLLGSVDEAWAKSDFFDFGAVHNAEPERRLLAESVVMELSGPGVNKGSELVQ
jgi:hypothetical protein